MKYQILNGDNIEILKTLESNSIDSIVTDPPYGIDFLGKAWDANTGALETYRECLRVLKPGGHLLAFSAARTYHHLAITLEQAGFEIRDQIMWIYSSGFPKSQDVGRSIQRSLGVKEYEKMVDTTKNAGFGQTDHARVRAGEEWSTPAKQVGQVKVTAPEAQKWEGWGTALKPAHEPICLARKPTKLSIQKNVQKWGTGALNIDACRVPYESEADKEKQLSRPYDPTAGRINYNGHYDNSLGVNYTPEQTNPLSELGRFPSNVIGEIADGYQKYFYCPKVSRKERHMGFELPPPMFGGVQGCYDPETGERFAVGFDDRATGKTKKKKYDPLAHIPTDPGSMLNNKTGTMYNADAKKLNVGNNHPTVKPVELMKYLIKLVTPPLGRVLDPFNGSGSTGMAAVELGCEYIGIEQDEKYCEISERRIAAHFKKSNPLRASGLFERPDKKDAK